MNSRSRRSKRAAPKSVAGSTHAYTLVGFSVAESFLVIVAVINIHHFVVDAFIGRLRRDRNDAVVTSNLPAAAAPAPAA